MHWWNGDGHMGWMALWWIVGALAVAAVVWALLRSAGGTASKSESPEEALKRRYAKGEIDDKTYKRMLEELRK